MKYVKVFLIILLVVIVLAVGVTIYFLKTFDLNNYKGQITSELGRSLGRDVKMGNIFFDFSLMEGLVLKVSGFSISNNSELIKQPFLLIGTTTLNVIIADILSKKKITFSEIVVDQPLVNLIMHKDGKLDLPEGTDQDSASATLPSADEEGRPAAQKGDFASQVQFVINTILVKGAGLNLFMAEGKGNPLVVVSEANCQVADVIYKSSQDNGYDLQARAQCAIGSVKMNDQPLISDVTMNIDVNNKDVELSQVKMDFAGGKVEGNVNAIDRQGVPEVSGRFDLTDISVGEIVKLSQQPIDIQGTLKGNTNFHTVLKKNEDPLKALTGEVQLSVSEGRVVNVNILKTVLEKLSFLPNLQERITQQFSPKYKDKLLQPDTEIRSVDIQSNIQSGVVTISQANVAADEFIVKANGQVDLEQNLKLAATLSVPADLSAELAASIGEMNYLMNENNEITIPFKPYAGKASDVRLYPDVTDIGKEVFQKKGKEELRDVLKKVLDVKETSEQQTPAGQEGEETPEQQPTAEEVLIDSILDQIPIFK